MPRPNGTFTFDPVLNRFRNAGGQLISENAVIPDQVRTREGSDDAYELVHGEHVAGAAGPHWIKQMRDGLRMPCAECGEMIGLGNVEMRSEHSRDWGRER
jgi:hypothetical protein